jgi:hypothetical protein
LLLLLLDPLSVVGVSPFPGHLHHEELVRVDLVQPDPNAHREHRPQVQCPPKQLSRVGQVRRVETVQRAVIAALVLLLGRVRTEARVAQPISPQCRVNQVR